MGADLVVLTKLASILALRTCAIQNSEGIRQISNPAMGMEVVGRGQAANGIGNKN